VSADVKRICMLNTFAMFALMTPLSCAFVAAAVARDGKVGTWIVILFAMGGLLFGLAAGAYSFAIERALTKPRQPPSALRDVAYFVAPMLSFCCATVLAGLLTFRLVRHLL